ncbi:MAG TPA: glycosyltransferase [Mycobacteriales bacterium]|nr:glycosyltransferase [Mycobacteriales bacterium]
MDQAAGRSAARVAVVVPTHCRAGLLGRLLAGLEAQLDSAEFELVVVDDASTDETIAVLEALAARSPLTVRVLRQQRNRGPAAARNLGWQATSATAIAFTDDDCAPEPGWLRGLLDGLETADIAQGRTIPEAEEIDRLGPFSRTLSVGSEDGFYQTCNIAYRREVLERLGGFDEAFRFPAGEDTDLAWRARESGATTVFCHDAVVRHTVRRSNLLGALRDTWRWQSAPQAISRHPQLRSLIYRPHIWRPAHPLVLLALVGIAAAVTSPWLGSSAATAAGCCVAVAALAPYAVHRLYRRPLPGTRLSKRVVLLPAAFLLDGAEVLACVVGSIRYRTLLI